MPDRARLSTNFFSATTRRTRSIHVPVDGGRHMLVPSQVIASPESGIQYRIEGMLGEGGFGQVYLARRLGRSRTIPQAVCIKVSASIDSWIREAYFAQLLDERQFWRLLGVRRPTAISAARAIPAS
jgi:serine/threonine protein kinase